MKKFFVCTGILLAFFATLAAIVATVDSKVYHKRYVKSKISR